MSRVTGGGPPPPSGLHIPGTLPGGAFGALEEGGYATRAEIADIYLDDGEPADLRMALPAVDHDRRLLLTFGTEFKYAEGLAPSALLFEHTKERRDQRSPAQPWKDDEGETHWQTEWQITGKETGVKKRDGGVNTRRSYDRLIAYGRNPDDKDEESDYRTDTQAITVYDFDWELHLVPGKADIYRRGVYVGPEMNRTPEPPLNAPEGEGAGKYREQELWLSTPYADTSWVDTILQAHLRDVWISGYLEVGQTLRETDRYFEVTHVHEREDTRLNAGYRSRVDIWLTFARVRRQYPASVGGEKELVEDRDQIADEQHNYPLVPGGTIRRSSRAPSVTLRDTIFSEWPEEADPDPIRFTAAGGQITVEGPRTVAPQLLEDREGNPTATLTAFGHAFRGGSWAAIRDAPVRDEKGVVTDWNRVLVLHAGSTAITAIRQDGSTETLSRRRFEREVLRVPAGSFVGFAPTGMFFNSWPHDWAWAVTKQDARAVTLHDAWRDSQAAKPRPDADPPPGPDHWYWKARPRRRPRRKPADPPVAPLRLTLADVTAGVSQDDPLKRAEGPLLLPETATVGRRDVRKIVAKRIFYPPAEWEDELDDRTSTAGPLKLTFKLPDPPRPPQGDQPGEDWGAALVLRLKTTKDTVIVNGETLDLGKLGHNRDEKRGWHPYVLPVPVAETYTLTFRGACSQALLCVRKWSEPGKAQEA